MLQSHKRVKRQPNVRSSSFPFDNYSRAKNKTKTIRAKSGL